MKHWVLRDPLDFEALVKFAPCSPSWWPCAGETRICALLRQFLDYGTYDIAFLDVNFSEIYQILLK